MLPVIKEPWIEKSIGPIAPSVEPPQAHTPAQDPERPPGTFPPLRAPFLKAFLPFSSIKFPI